MDYSDILSRFNIKALNPMQSAAVTSIVKGGDVMLISPTGSGKTLGFLLPLVQMLDSKKEQVQVLIIVPSRELAIQIEQVFKQMGTEFKINSCYGGHSVKIEENNLMHPPAVLVGTPGRISHHLRKKNLVVDAVLCSILDEFDKSLEFGFKVEMKYIIQKCRNLERRILTSATVLDQVPGFVGLNNVEIINFTGAEKVGESGLTIKLVNVPGDDKLEALLLLLGKKDAASTIVFCNHREAVNRISDQLKIYEVDHGIYHGGLEQIDREKNLIKLRNGSVKILICTDLASRGLDIPEIESVIHYQLPGTKDIMIHRNGRTARMNAKGYAYFLIDAHEVLPKYLDLLPEEEKLPSKFIVPQPSLWKTLYIGAGKKDKINKMDIVGMLCKKGKLENGDLGKIEVLDHSAYAAVKTHKIYETFELVREEKIKNKKVKIAISTI